MLQTNNETPTQPFSLNKSIFGEKGFFEVEKHPCVGEGVNIHLGWWFDLGWKNGYKKRIKPLLSPLSSFVQKLPKAVFL